MTQFILGHGIGMIDLVAQDQEGHFAELFHGQQGVELGFGFGESLEVFCVDEEDDSAYFGEVVFPKAAGWMTQFVSGEKGDGCLEGEEYPAGDRPGRTW